MKPALLLLLFFCTCSSAWAQPAITGRITDSKKQPVVAATVSLIKAADSLTTKTALSTQDGSFRFEQMSSGDYRILASATGYKSTLSAPVTVQRNSFIQTDLELQPNAGQLQGVVVTGHKQSLEQHADKLVLNVQNSPLAAGATAAEILRRIPGLRVLNDRIVMTGKNKLSIMIDGRLSQYQDMNTLLRAIPATNIDRIELMSNPGARFDAEGDAVINIILKRKRMVGTSGTFGYATGTSAYNLREVAQGTKLYQRYNPSVSINHQSGNFSIFANYNFLYRTQFEVNKINRYKEDSSYNQQNYNPLNIATHTYQLGMDYKIDSLNTISLQVSGLNRSARGDYKNASAQSSISTGSKLDTFNSRNHQYGHNNSIAINLNWRHLFAPGKTLSVDADAAHYGLHNTNTIDIHPFRNNKIHHFQSVQNPIKFATVKGDFVSPLGKTSRLEAGLKTSFAGIDNNLAFQQNGQSDPTHTNRFLYRENINAAYASYLTSKGKWDVQAGLRGEQTMADASSRGRSVLHRNYVQAFPSMLLTRHLDSTWGLTAQYSRRIGRPGYQQQNPFEVYLDPLTYTRGNPLLRPQIINSTKLTLTYTGLPALTLSYDETSDVIVEYAPQQKMVKDANGTARLVSFSVADNLARSKNFSAQLNFPLKLSTIADGYGGVITTLQQYHALYQGATFRATKWSYVFFAQADLKFSEKWVGQFSAYYATPSQYEFIQAGKNSSVDAGIARKMMNGKARLSLTVSDLFFGDKTLGKIKYQDIDLHLKQYSDTRNIILAFTYHFGSQHIKATEAHTTGAEEENKRVKTEQ